MLLILMRAFRGAAVLKRQVSDAHDAGLLGCFGWCCGNGGALMLLMRAFQGAAVLKRKGYDAHDAGLFGCSGRPCVETEGP